MRCAANIHTACASIDAIESTVEGTNGITLVTSSELEAAPTPLDTTESGTALVAAFRAHSSPRAMEVARWSLAVLMIVFGAGVHIVYLLTDQSGYAIFADASQFAFVRETWQSLVVPNTWFFITILLLAELAAGIAIAVGDRWMRAGLIALIGFHLGMLFFGWFFWAWTPPMILCFVLLLRAQRHMPTPPLRLHLPSAMHPAAHA